MLAYDLYITVDSSNLSEHIFSMWRSKYPYAKRWKNEAVYTRNWWHLDHGYTLPFDLPTVPDYDLRFDNKFVQGHTLTLHARRPEGIKWIDFVFRTVPKQHDAFFLYTNELNCKKNYEQACKFFPHLVSVRGGDSIYESHKICSELALTENFFVIDADNWVLANPNYWVPDWDKHYVHVWNSRDPNGLEYGHGGLKLFNKQHFYKSKLDYQDMTLTVGNLKPHFRCMSEHRFNFSAYNTWRTAFREATKLKHSTDPDAVERLTTWLTVGHYDYGQLAVAGAQEALKTDIDINDPHKLLEHFLKWTRNQPTT